MSTSRRPTLLGVAAAFALALAPPVAASASAEEPGDGAPVLEKVDQSPAEVREYWTPARMRAADGVEPPRGFDLSDGGKRTASAAAQPPDIEIPAGFETLYPYRIHGRLFITLGGRNGSCSATVVTSFTLDLIMTAGHCVSLTALETGGSAQFATNVLFVPGYRDGARPFGTYAATSLGAPSIWLQEADSTFDVGVANLAPSALGPIQSLLGSRGVTFNRPIDKYKNDVFNIFGYPAQPAGIYNGQLLIECDSTYRGQDVLGGGIVAGPCHMQEGSSGGGWVRDGKVNSVISHGACLIPSTACDIFAGPYFEDTAFELWNATSGGVSKGKRKKIKKCKKKTNKKDKRQKCLNKLETFDATGG